MESCVRFVTPPSSILMLFYSVASYPLAGQQPGWEVGSPTSQIYTSEIQQPSIDVYALLQGRVVGMTVLESGSMAAAVTQYGTDASEGVILIFTKRGRPARIRWTAQVDQGFSRVLPFGPADIDWRSVADDDEVCPPDATGRYGDEPCDPSYLYMQPWLRNGWRQKYSLSAAGGSETVGYYMAGSFQDIDGVLPLDGERKYHRQNTSSTLSR